ncbi:hypothetical protein CYMTET_49488 [Cymbomonas tetramitiformis]|uniref:Uncharacterized protein n=1 Tax=Cymbomonas tetramitiformis TaxID=36881 RepID=A0AAE0BPZ9_9CHLO|nr:hypothetical protein CYMTET_49488 [Cymbomonas tetramitiformis]
MSDAGEEAGDEEIKASSTGGYKIPDQPPAPPEPAGGGDSGDMVTSILWDPQSFHKRRSLVVPVPKYLTPDETFSNITAEQAVEGLRLGEYLTQLQEWEGGLKGIVLIIGGTDTLTTYIAQEDGMPELPDGMSFTEAIQRLKLTFSRGVTRAALDTHSVVVTSGFDAGAVGYLGRANKDRHHRIPLVGVVGGGLTTWPGDVKPTDEKELKHLQPDHTHYIMMDTGYDEYAVRKFRFDVSKALQDVGGAAPGIPIVAFVVNGNDDELEETLMCVRWGIPVAIVKGSGGFADSIAKEMDNPDIDDYIVNEKVLEIVKEGTLESIDLKDIDGAVIRDLVKRLFGGGAGPSESQNLLLAWELYGVYMKNYGGLASSGRSNYIITLALNVLLTTMVSIKLTLLDAGLKDIMLDAFSMAIIILPILISVILVIDSRFGFGKKAKVLISAAASIESQVYVFRTGMGDYLAAAASKRNDVLANHIKTIRMNVMGTSVAEGSLDQSGALDMKQKNYAVSAADDGRSKLSPEEYINFRSAKLMGAYERKALTQDKFLKRYLLSIYLLSGISSILALSPDTQVYVAVTIAFSVAFASLIEASGYAVKLGAFNRAATELRNTIAWWRALSPIEQANPQNFADLVKKTENTRKNENNATNPGTDMTGGGGGGADGLDVEALAQDVRDNLDKDGKITFASAWINSHGPFFTCYNAWLESKLEVEVAAKMKNGGAPAGGGGDGDEDTSGAVTELTLEDPLFAAKQLTEVLVGMETDDIQLEGEQPIDDTPSDPVPSILWDADDFYERESKVVEVNAEMDMSEAVLQAGLPDWLEKHQGHTKGVNGVIILVGVSDDLAGWLESGEMPDGLTRDQARRRLRLIFGRGIEKAAIDTHSVIVTGGVDLGVINYMGAANKDSFHKCPLLGVGAKGVTTWPGDTRPAAEKRTQLEPNHSHHMLLETMRDVAGVTRYRIDVIKDLVKNATLGGKGADPVPVIVFVINGSEAAIMETVQFVRMGWPIAVIKGSGGAADKIADACVKIKDDFVPNPRLVEIAKEGRVECVNILDCEGGGIRTMITRLFLSGGALAFFDPNLVFAWELIIKYRSNAAMCAQLAHRFQVAILAIGVILTGLVCFMTDLETEMKDAGVYDLLYLFVLVLPIGTSVLGLIQTAFKFSSRAAVLKGAVEDATIEVYEYRAGMGDYMNAADEARNDMLAARLTDISKGVVSSGVGESGLRLEGVEAARKKEFRVSEEDSGFSVLSPEDYAQLRLTVQIQLYQKTSNGIEKSLRYLQIAVYLLGGIGTGLATLGYSVYVALAAALQLALSTFIETKRYEDKLAFYNAGAADLESRLSWWRSLSTIQMANPLKYAEMVKATEGVKQAEISLLNPAAGGGGGGGGDPPTFNLTEFKSDVADAIQKDGRVKFKQGWVEKHSVFFMQYEEWLDKNGFFTVRTTRLQAKYANAAPLPAPADDE